MGINKKIDEFNQEQADILTLCHVLWQLTNDTEMADKYKAFNAGVATGIFTRIIEKYGRKNKK